MDLILFIPLVGLFIGLMLGWDLFTEMFDEQPEAPERTDDDYYDNIDNWWSWIVFSNE